MVAQTPDGFQRKPNTMKIAVSGKTTACVFTYPDLVNSTTSRPDTRRPGPYFALGELFVSAGDKDEAETYLRKALARGPAPPAVASLSALYGQTNRLNELVDLVETARGSGDVPVPALLNLCRAYLDLGMASKAKGPLDDAAKHASQEWAPSIYDMRQALRAKGVT